MREAAEALRLTAQDLKKLGIVDEVLKEPVGGAQRDKKAVYKTVHTAIKTALDELTAKKREALIKSRRKKFLDMGSKGLAA